jgi:RecA/RadA recombinase
MGRVKIVGVDDLEQGFSYINEVCAGKHEILIPGRKMYRDDEILNAKVTWLRQVCQEWEATWDEALDTDRKRILADLKAKGAIANPGELRPHLIIWDSISASSPRLEMDAAKRSDSPMNAGGMGLTARVLKTNLKATATVMYGKPVTVILLAQVMLTDFGSYQGPSETFAGGSALKHYCHYILYYEFKKKLKNDGELTNHGTQSRVYIEKSKFSPTSQGVWIVIDDTLGGRIVQREEAIVACIDLGIISGSGWYKFKDEPDMKSMRFNDMVGNEEIRKKCIDKLAKYYRMNYLTIDMMYKEAGNTLGELSEDERNQKWSNSLIKLDDELFVKSEDKKND